MTLITSISGIRGTINDSNDICLSPDQIVKYSHLFGEWLKSNRNNNNMSIVIGRDARPTGHLISNIITSTLQMMGFVVIDLELTTTPTVQLAIIHENCDGGIMISASHNPIEWNGLKLLNNLGEFLSPSQSQEVFNFIANQFSLTDHLKANSLVKMDYLNRHIQSILDLKDVNIEQIRKRKFKIVVDGINSSGGIYVPLLLKAIGVEVIELNCVPNGLFAHNPEPIPLNLKTLSNRVIESKADLGIAVDPDVDRLVLVCEDGSFFGEEYTIVSVAKFILSKYTDSCVVSNLSTTKALEDVAIECGAQHFSSAVGEINVVELMKIKSAIIGGEGSGGVIFPESHYGRDALVGIALFLTYVADLNKSVKQLRMILPNYYMIKEKIKISKNFKFNLFIENQINNCHKYNYQFNLIDGLKIIYKCGGWAHIRTSNTEPIIRVISESKSEERSLEIQNDILNNIKNNQSK